MEKLKQLFKLRITKILMGVILFLAGIIGYFYYLGSKSVGYQITFFNNVEYGYYGLFGNNTVPLEGNPDVKTFMVLKNQDFAKDKNHVWNKHYLLKEADRATFEVTNFYHNSGHTNYSKDKSHVWCGEFLLKDADPATFMQLVVSSGFTKDKNHVYYDKHLLVDADPATFKLIDDGSSNGGVPDHYAKDTKTVYFFEEKIVNADAATFQIIKNSSFSKDKNNVYYFGELLPEADANTFELVKEFDDCAKDKNHVFKGKQIVPKADPATFKINDKGEGYDKNGIVQL
jgi:DKNYY family